jgi:hypothetical protein
LNSQTQSHIHPNIIAATFHCIVPAPVPQTSRQAAGAGLPEINFCDTFDLTTKIKPEALQSAKTTLISPPTCFDDNYNADRDDYEILMEELQSVIVGGGFR